MGTRAMEQHAIRTEPASGAVFRDYVRGVLAELSERSRVLLARRMRWLRRIRERTSAEERWENEGGAMW